MEKIKELYVYHVAFSYVDYGKLSTGMLIMDLDFMIKTGDDVMEIREEIERNISGKDVVILGWNLLEG